MNTDEFEQLKEKFEDYKAEKLKSLAQALRLNVKIYDDTQQIAWDSNANRERYTILNIYSSPFPRFNRYVSNSGYPFFSPTNVREIDPKIFLSNSEYPENIYSEPSDSAKSSLKVRNQQSAKLLIPGLNFRDIRFRNNLTIIDSQYNYLYQAFDDSIFVYLLHGDEKPSLKHPVLEIKIQDRDISESDLENANWRKLPNGINQLKLETFLKFNLLIAACDNSRIYFFDTAFIHESVQKRICDPSIPKQIVNEFTFKFYLDSSVWGIEVLGDFGIILVSSNDRKVTSFELFLDQSNDRLTFGKRFYTKCEYDVPELRIINKHTIRLLEIDDTENCNNKSSDSSLVSKFQLLTGNIDGKVVKLEYVFSLKVLPILNSSIIKESLQNALIKDLSEPFEEKEFMLKIYSFDESENSFQKITDSTTVISANSGNDKIEEQFYSQDDLKYGMGFNTINFTKFEFSIWGLHEISRKDFVKIGEACETELLTKEFLDSAERIDSSLSWINRDIFKKKDSELIENLVGISDFPSLSFMPIQELSVSVITMLTYLCKLKAIESGNIPLLEPGPLTNENYIITTFERGHALLNSELIMNSFGVCPGIMFFIFSCYIPEICCHIRIDVAGLIYITRFYEVQNKFVCSRLYKIINLYERITEFQNENVILDPGYIVGFDIKKIKSGNDLVKFDIYIVDNRQTCFVVSISEDMFTNASLAFDF